VASQFSEAGPGAPGKFALHAPCHSFNLTGNRADVEGLVGRAIEEGQQSSSGLAENQFADGCVVCSHFENDCTLNENKSPGVRKSSNRPGQSRDSQVSDLLKVSEEPVTVDRLPGKYLCLLPNRAYGQVREIDRAMLWKRDPVLNDFKFLC